MKKTIISILMSALLLIGVVAAFNMPHPIYGTIEKDGFALSNVLLEIENKATGVKAEALTNDKGFYQVDLGNIDDRYRDGDTISVKIKYCSTIPVCIKETKVSGGGNEVSWDVIDTPTITPPATIKYVCSDGRQVDSASECTVVPPVVEIVCYDGTKVTDEADCPVVTEDNTIEIALGILSALLAIALGILAKFKWGKGFVALANYYKKLGDEAKARKDYATAKKYYERAAKMVSTAVTKAKDGSYK